MLNKMKEQCKVSELTLIKGKNISCDGLPTKPPLPFEIVSDIERYDAYSDERLWCKKVIENSNKANEQHLLEK